jgi:hypothetical protein
LSQGLACCRTEDLREFVSLLPYKEKIIHIRWSGEGCWIPLGDLGLGYENPTSHPAPGQFILHPGGIGETEILLRTILPTRHYRSSLHRLHTLAAACVPAGAHRGGRGIALRGMNAVA